MDAAEAERCGLVSRVIPAGKLVEEAVETAQKIAELSLPIVMMAKESVNRAFETTLTRACASSAACSTRPSPPRTRKKAWRRLRKSASRASSTDKVAGYVVVFGHLNQAGWAPSVADGYFQAALRLKSLSSLSAPSPVRFLLFSVESCSPPASLRQTRSQRRAPRLRRRAAGAAGQRRRGYRARRQGMGRIRRAARGGAARRYPSARVGLYHEHQFWRGPEVSRGDILAVIDQRPYEAELKRAQAELANARSRATCGLAPQARARSGARKVCIEGQFSRTAERAARRAGADPCGASGGGNGALKC